MVVIVITITPLLATAGSMYKHTRLDRVIDSGGIHYKFSGILMNSNGPDVIHYIGNVYDSNGINARDLYSGGDYMMGGWAYFTVDGYCNDL
jgi:hypothetical protein